MNRFKFIFLVLIIYVFSEKSFSVELVKVDLSFDQESNKFIFSVENNDVDDIEIYVNLTSKDTFVYSAFIEKDDGVREQIYYDYHPSLAHQRFKKFKIPKGKYQDFTTNLGGFMEEIKLSDKENILILWSLDVLIFRNDESIVRAFGGSFRVKPHIPYEFENIIEHEKLKKENSK
jgi:hypothetical protein